MNKKKLVSQKINELNKLFFDRKNPATWFSEKILEKMESLLISYLKNHPQDTDMWLKLIMVEFTPPWEDYDRIEKYVTTILEYDKNNAQALLVLAYAQRAFRGDLSDELFIRLQNCSDTITDKKLLSMIYLAIAWYYYSWPSYKDEKKYELSLLKSIDYCSKYVKNYELLGRLYLKKDKKAEGQKMIQQALKNITKVYNLDDDSTDDITDINEFFYEFFTGTHVMESNLESLRKFLD